MLGVWYKSVNFGAETDLALEKGVPVRCRVRGIHAFQERIHHLGLVVGVWGLGFGV